MDVTVLFKVPNNIRWHVLFEIWLNRVVRTVRKRWDRNCIYELFETGPNSGIAFLWLFS